MLDMQDQIKMIEWWLDAPVTIDRVIGRRETTIYACVVDADDEGAQIKCPGETAEAAVQSLYDFYAKPVKP